MYFIDARVPSVSWAFAVTGLCVCVCVCVRVCVPRQGADNIRAERSK
jgi:hypothetical protein